MIYRQNLHTHTTYCDGKDTPREITEAAIRQNLDSLGFSGHSYMHYSPMHSMSLEGTKDYIKEICSLRDEYADRIKLFCGIEFDMYSTQVDLANFDYVIGAVHYLLMNGEYIGFDRSQKEVEAVIHTHFHGDGMAYVAKYYETLSQLPKYGKIDIVGHFDLISKHCEKQTFFDGNSAEYLDLAMQAAKTLSGDIPYFEVNTGAIARGYRTAPYPSVPILKGLKSLGFQPIISSDCHDARALTCGFEQAEELLKYCGYKHRFVLTENGFQPVKIGCGKSILSYEGI